MENAEFQRIDEARKTLNFQNFSEMAAKLGVSAQVFTDIKKGKHGISKRLADAIHALDERISVSWLLTGDGSMMSVGGNVAVNVTGGNNQVNADAALVKALEIAGKSQEQIDKLLLIIEKLTT